jgi:predicted transcriptional regulator
MEYKLSDAELTIMQILWDNGEMRATEIADIAKGKYGWEKNTGYTFLHLLIKKGAVTRRDPGFYCAAACERNALLAQEAREMVDKLYSGSIGQFVTSFFGGKAVTQEEKAQLQRLINEHNGGI